MRKTIQTGAAFEQLAQPESPDPRLTAPLGTQMPIDSSSVRPLPNHVLAAADGGKGADPQQLRAALADTHQDMSRDSFPPPKRPARNPNLGRTLRMELKLGPSLPPESEAPGGARPLGTAEPEQSLIFGSTQPVGDRSTGDFQSSRPALSSTSPLPDFRAPYEFGTSTSTRGSSPSFPPAQPRKRELRPGERTMIMTRKKSSTRDWLFVVLLVGALGVTASMLFSYRNQNTSDGEEPVDGAEAEDTFHDSALQSTSSEGTAAARPGTADPRTPAATAVAATAEVQATELRSVPSGAEVVVGGAVVGNTPVRVARAAQDIDYELRLSGYDPQVVRVGSQSPASIAVTLHRVQAQAP